MKRIAGAVSVMVGVTSGLLGLLFLVGYGGQMHRLLVGAIGLLLSGILVGLGVLWWKQAQARTPEQVRTDVLALASRRGGSITEADVVAALPDRAELAVKALTEMVRGGFCTPQVVSGVTRYEFPQLVGTVLVRRCGHCGWEAPLMSQASVCAQCGAPVKTGRASDDEAIGLH
jgi:hypothetical protein